MDRQWEVVGSLGGGGRVRSAGNVRKAMLGLLPDYPT